MVRMTDRDAKFNQGTRVRLRANIDSFVYGDYAVYGNEGTVEAIRHDRFGLPEIFVKWDKNHWAYNGVDDCWTFEDHFELIEDSMSDKKQQQKAALQALVQLFGLEEEPTPVSKQEKGSQLRNIFANAAQVVQEEPEDKDFARAVEAASQKIAESEAFVIIGIDRHNHPRAPEGILEPYAATYSKTPEGEVLLTAHMAHVAARAHQDLAMQAIHNLLSEDED